tara:strand:- start:477 stop:947 length:471 start_codon:yes stop_codon:yes gene_type:complete
MKDILEVVKLTKELEKKKKQIFEQSNSNTMGAVTEHTISRWLTYSKGSQYLCIGGNQKGFDVTCDKFKDTYEVKHTNTTSSAYHYGNLESKDAKYIVFVKWEYSSSLLNAEYAYIFPNNVVKENLNKRGKFTMSNLHKTAHLAEDITESLNNFISK